MSKILCTITLVESKDRVIKCIFIANHNSNMEDFKEENDLF